MAVAQRAVVPLPSCRADLLRELKDTFEMDRPLNFEDEDSGYQSLGVGAYLEEAKGRCLAYNWEIEGPLPTEKPLGEFGG